jgi:8-oxo-dGTP pyrophosphatase MutT (NUDIX family)
MLRRIEHAALRAAYTLAYVAREAYWQLRRPTLVGVWALVRRGDEVLLIRHRGVRAGWMLPGGGAERHERLPDAACREVLEEAGVPARAEHLLGIYESFRGGITNYIAVFVCSAEADARPPKSLEIDEARYFPIGALPEDIDPGSRRRIAEHLAGERGLSKPW